MTETLKPCPFCGGKAKLTDLTQAPESRVECTECGTRTRFFSNSEEAVEYWNTRPIEDNKVKYEPTSYSCRACKNATDSEIKRLREALEKIKTKLENVPQSGLTIYDGADIYGECCDALTGEEE